MKIAKPGPEEYAAYYQKYIDRIKTDDLISSLKKGRKRMMKLVSKLNKKQLDYRYAEGKWTIKEILVHLMDAERVFGYRALRFARYDKTPLAAFEENDYVPASKATTRKLKSLMEEYDVVRDATISLFENFDENMMMQVGTASNKPMSVRALLYVIAGHELHHIEIIKERYLKPNGQSNSE